MNSDQQLETLVELKVELRMLRREQAEIRKQLHALQREFDQSIGAKIADRFTDFEQHVSKRIEDLAIKDERHSQQIIALVNSMKSAGVDVDAKGLNVQVTQQTRDQQHTFSADQQQNQLGDENQQS